MRNSRANMVGLLLVMAIITVIGLSVNSNVGSVESAGQGGTRPTPTPPKKRIMGGGRSSPSPTPKPLSSPSPTPPQGFRPTNPKIELILIPAGTFFMGSGDGPDGDRHRVSISREFYIAKSETTQAQWAAVMDTDPSLFKGDDLPVERVSWDDVQEFTKRLNQMNDGFTYRLPTEAEWEYACKAGSPDDWPRDLDSTAWYFSNSRNHTHPVRSTQKPNAFGLYDMLGNVWEWCQDFYDEAYYKSGHVTDPVGPLTGTSRVVRGASFDNGAMALRCAQRNPVIENVMLIGFRVAAVRNQVQKQRVRQTK